MATVVLMGTPDTKAEELRWVRDRVVSLGCDVTLVDVGTFSDGTLADIAAGAVIDAGGGNLEELRRARDRGAAMDAMGRGAAVLVDRLHEEGRLDARARDRRLERLVGRGSGDAGPAGRRPQAARLHDGVRRRVALRGVSPTSR